MKILVIGAGPSGMMSAITLAKKGHQVTLVEKKDRPGKKLLATGNGRCNMSNEKISLDYYFGEDKNFPKEVLTCYGEKEIRAIFGQMGLEMVCLDQGKLYPMSLQSKSVLDVLCRSMRKYKVTTHYKWKVDRIETCKKGFLIHGKETLYADKVVCAMGGNVMKKSGSDGDGYRLAQSLGHRITRIFPGIVQLRLEEDTKPIQGVKIQGAVGLEAKDPHREYGDVLFTDYGISGPPILQWSSKILRKKEKKERVSIYIDLLPTISKKSFWTKRRQNHGELSAYDFLIGLVHEKLLDYFFTKEALPKEKKIMNYREDDFEKLISRIHAWEFHVKGALDLDQGQVTCGGVDTKEINPKTMESYLVKGLYFVGEVMDVDGACGGYNLHWAWASALALGEGIGYAKRI